MEGSMLGKWLGAALSVETKLGDTLGLMVPRNPEKVTPEGSEM